MQDRYFQHTLSNGLTLLAERMPGMQSAAMTLLVPAGSSTDPNGSLGSATVLSDLVLRGAGARDNRALTEHLDSLGLQRSASVGTYHSRFACAAVAARVMDGVATYSDIVRRPHLPESGFTAARDLALQALAGVDDEPQKKLMIKLREWFFPAPFGRNSMGEKPDLQKLSIADARADHSTRYQPHGAILAFAGAVEFDALKRLAEQHFGDWQANPARKFSTVERAASHHFEPAKSEQTHIGIAYPSISETHADYYVARMAIEVLSGGMSGRLFTEVREKRALCYSVGASYGGLKDRGAILGYAGTSNDRAQATLDCFLHEIHRLSDGVTRDELERAKIGLKASTIMSGESTSGRAASIAHDFFVRGRIRSMDEIIAAIDGVTVDRVNEFLKVNKPGPFTIVIVGPRELKLPESGGI